MTSLLKSLRHNRGSQATPQQPIQFTVEHESGHWPPTKVHHNLAMARYCALVHFWDDCHFGQIDQSMGGWNGDRLQGDKTKECRFFSCVLTSLGEDTVEIGCRGFTGANTHRCHGLQMEEGPQKGEAEQKSSREQNKDPSDGCRGVVGRCPGHSSTTLRCCGFKGAKTSVNGGSQLMILPRA